MSDAIAGVGTQFLRTEPGSSSGAEAAIAEINSITGPGMTRDFIDVTSLDSTGGYREFIGGFRDGGQLTLNMNFAIEGYLIMLSDFENDVEAHYAIELADTGVTRIDFDGFVTDLPLTITPDDKVTADVTIKITGQVFVQS
jgi:predicted secreted protein